MEVISRRRYQILIYIDTTFNIDIGTIELETRENEFLDLQNSVGNFVDGELAYSFKGTSYSI